MPETRRLTEQEELESLSSRTNKVVLKTVEFSGAAGNGAVGTINLFTVTGDVILSIFGICTEDIVGATATIEVGVTGQTGGILPSTTGTSIDNGMVWEDATPAAMENIATTYIIPAGKDIIATIATAAITDGTIKFYCLWTPLSADGNVVAA